jgi:photosystem II stability/assembly factor-like uncharacterized protein
MAVSDERGEGVRPGPAPRQDAWRIIGPGGGGGMFFPTVSPHDPGIVLEHCDMTGAYITADGGLSWRMFNLRTVVQCFAFDPQDLRVIYAGNAALWRSEDAGKTWRMILPNPTRNTVEHMCGDHADYFLTSDDPAYPRPGRRILAIAVDPTNSSRLHVVFSSGYREGRPTLLFLSEDRGGSWRQVTELPARQVHAFSLVPTASAQNSTIYLVSDAGVHRGADDRWNHLPGPPGGEVRAASIGLGAEASAPVIYATTASAWKDGGLVGGISVSEDGGRTWRGCGDGVAALIYEPGHGHPPDFRAAGCAAGDGLTAYVGVRNLQVAEGEEGRIFAILKTTDAGRSWSVVWKETRSRPADNMEVSWLEARMPDSYPHVFFIQPLSIGVAPTDPDVCYVTDIFRTYRTLDGGQSWQQVTSVRADENSWTTRGLDVTTCYGVHFDPFDVNHVFISYTDIGLSQSEDGGKSWMSAVAGVPQRWKNTAYWVEFDPAVRGLMWGAFAFHHDLPRPKMWRQTDPAEFLGGVATSTDGGKSWLVTNRGMPESSITHILLDPASPVGERVLYACGFGRGVFKSADNGKSWVLRNQGIEKKQPFAWRIVRADSGTLYLIVARRSDDGRIGDEEDGALYRSTDGAENWVTMTLPAGCNGPTDLALDPTDSRRMYLAAWGVYSPQGDTGGGLFLSEDGGETWVNIFSRAQHVYAVTIAPGNPKNLYISGFDSAAYRSADGGRTWSRIKGFTFKWGHRVMLDPADRTRVYITTFGGSVWHGPALGDPSAREDIITPLSAWKET